jgi:hypothetical protein
LGDEEHCVERLLFGYFFLAVEEKVTGSKGFESKTGRTPVSAAHALRLNIALNRHKKGRHRRPSKYDFY